MKELLSRPVWGAWIEIYDAITQTAAYPVSRPAWGAWIEMVEDASDLYLYWSRPAWGAWIEISVYQTLYPVMVGRAPHGARGLKWLVYLGWLLNGGLSRPAWGAWIEISRIAHADICVTVAPRMGRVD